MSLDVLAEFVGSDDPVTHSSQAEALALEDLLLSSQDESRFTLTAYVPLEQPTLHDVVGTLAELETRLVASVLLAFMDPEHVSNFKDINSLVREYRSRAPMVVTDVSIDSITVTVEGDADEIAEFMNRPKSKNWFKKLVKGVGALCAGGVLMFGTPPAQIPLLPPPAEAKRIVSEACGYLPPGSVVTVKTGPIELEVPCKAD